MAIAMFMTEVVPQQSIAGVISVCLPPFAAAVAVLQVANILIVTPRFHVKHCRGNGHPCGRRYAPPLGICYAGQSG